MRWLRTAFGFVAALVILFEEWGWEPLQAAIGRIAHWPPIAWLERRLAALPPYAALAVFAVPGLALLPVKLGALALITRGHAALGLLLIVAAKLIGTAIVARLFALLRPALMQLGWFARGYARWTTWKDGWLARVRASAGWQAAIRIKRRLLLAVNRWR
ncbi:MAG: hypothetical protein QFE16_04545 [Pseudomonadota bacterium]|nr:hypothetical protein [Pseudomonadota bacterium]